MKDDSKEQAAIYLDAMRWRDEGRELQRDAALWRARDWRIERDAKRWRNFGEVCGFLLALVLSIPVGALAFHAPFAIWAELSGWEYPESLAVYTVPAGYLVGPIFIALLQWSPFRWAKHWRERTCYAAGELPAARAGLRGGGIRIAEGVRLLDPGANASLTVGVPGGRRTL